MRILLTGGSGTFGRAVVPLLNSKRNEVWNPPRKDLDVTDLKMWERACAAFSPEIIVHAAAFTGVDRAENMREECYRVNVDGTRFGIQVAKRERVRFVYISTDYVFDGEKGNYDVGDRLGPLNYYALTKTLGEMVVTGYSEGAIIRTSFAPDGPWRYEGAWEDLYTGKDYISVLAPQYVQAILMPFTGIVHIATERKSVFELARRQKPDVKPIPRASAPMPLPYDVSLNTASWEFVRKCWMRVSRSRSSP